MPIDTLAVRATTARPLGGGRDVSGQPWESMTPEQQHAEWIRFQHWQRSQQLRAVPASTGPKHIQLGTRAGRRVLLAGTVAVLLFLALSVVPSVLGAGTTTVSGSMTVVGNTNALTSSYTGAGTGGGTCTTYGGYGDIAEGVAVTIRNADGAIAGVGRLGAGQGGSYGCIFPFSVADVPESEFYTVEISHRGQVTVTAENVRNGDIKLSLG